MIFLFLLPLIILVIFIKHVLICDALLLGFITFIFCFAVFKIHPAISVAIAIGVLIGTLVLASCKVGFIILTIASTGFYTVATCSILMDRHFDMTWTVVITILVGLFVLGVHLIAKRKM